MGFPCGSDGKESACNVGDLGSIPRLGRSPGEGKGYPLQYSGLENSTDCIVHAVTKSRTQLSNFHSLHFKVAEGWSFSLGWWKNFWWKTVAMVTYSVRLLHDPNLCSKKQWRRALPGGPVVKNPLARAGDMGSVPGPGKFHMPRGN